MKKELFIKAQKGGVSIFSADGKTEHAFLRKLKSGVIVRTFYESVCDGILVEGANCSNMSRAITETKEKIKVILDLKKPGR
ncbi:MAG: hypothetical protein ACYC3G_02015 [Minisyncoccota bacterium]